MNRHSVLGAAVTAAALLAAPATASAVTGSVDQPCFSTIPGRGSEPLVVHLSGGTPNGSYVLTAKAAKGTGTAGSTSGTFDATGAATATITSLSVPGGSSKPSAGRAVDLVVKDIGAGGAETPVASAKITNLTMDVVSNTRRVRAVREIRVSGTPFAGQTLYAFIVKGSSSKVLKRIALGKTNACGYVTRKAIVAPPSGSRGSYRLYVNPGITLKKSKAIYFGFTIS